MFLVDTNVISALAPARRAGSSELAEWFDRASSQLFLSVISAADRFVSYQKKQGFGYIYRPKGGIFAWGSNHLMLQNLLVTAAAFDLTGEKHYLAAAREAMDYLLGRNPMNISYITGYGTAFAHNQHSRWYAHQLDPALPSPPFLPALPERPWPIRRIPISTRASVSCRSRCCPASRCS